MLSTFICREGSAATGTPSLGPFRFYMPLATGNPAVHAKAMILFFASPQ
jgi:hypothetical protein